MHCACKKCTVCSLYFECLELLLNLNHWCHTCKYWSLHTNVVFPEKLSIACKAKVCSQESITMNFSVPWRQNHHWPQPKRKQCICLWYYRRKGYGRLTPVSTFETLFPGKWAMKNFQRMMKILWNILFSAIRSSILNFAWPECFECRLYHW